MDKKKKHEGNVYDKLFKENAEFVVLPLIKSQLGISVKSYKVLKDRFNRTIEREVDFLYEVQLEGNENMILHIEFQSSNDKNMIYWL